MRDLLQNLTSVIELGDSESKEEAVLQLALIFEKHSPLRETQKFYESNLDKDLFSIKLNKAEIEELIQKLDKILRSNTTSSLVWAIGKAQTLSSTEVMLSILSKDTLQNDENVLWQALIAIENYFSSNLDYPKKLLEQKKKLASLNNLSNYRSKRIVEISQRLCIYINK